MRKGRGFTLMEASAALAVVGLTLFLAGALLTAGPQGTSRITAGRAALQAAGSALEAVRAGALPLRSGAVAVPGGSPEVSVTLAVRPAGLPGLHEVRATARALTRGRAVERSVTTLVWRQP